MLKIKKALILLLAESIFWVGCKPDEKASIFSEKSHYQHESLGKNNLAYRWAEVALEATAHDTERFKPRPTVTSRYLALVFVSMFDAWSRYDEKAIPVYLSKVDRRPDAEQNDRNKEIAISYAAYRALSEYYFSDTIMLKKYMSDFGFNPENRSTDVSTPEGIGNLAAMAVIEARRN